MLGSLYATNVAGMRVLGLEGWRFAFLTVAAFSAILAVAIALLVDDPRCPNRCLRAPRHLAIAVRTTTGAGGRWCPRPPVSCSALGVCLLLNHRTLLQYLCRFLHPPAKISGPAASMLHCESGVLPLVCWAARMMCDLRMLLHNCSWTCVVRATCICMPQQESGVSVTVVCMAAAGAGGQRALVPKGDGFQALPQRDAWDEEALQQEVDTRLGARADQVGAATVSGPPARCAFTSFTMCSHQAAC
jgi:hypothetical protein